METHDREEAHSYRAKRALDQLNAISLGDVTKENLSYVSNCGKVTRDEILRKVEKIRRQYEASKFASRT
jgi:ribonuclease HII